MNLLRPITGEFAQDVRTSDARLDALDNTATCPVASDVVCGDGECAGQEDGEMVEFAGWEGNEYGRGNEEGVRGVIFEAFVVCFAGVVEWCRFLGC